MKIDEATGSDNDAYQELLFSKHYHGKYEDLKLSGNSQQVFCRNCTKLEKNYKYLIMLDS